ncbi:cap-specific mRNA (nucleoside-2'-O-)-methyltransferase 2 [Pseudophryne corroboree]|uniref:cap-specific mRNA (nucleoside-2'-O-)-methyltransferase 2 n=1 Tax=Pseudophryne corroboree TaxID=495146 RepID=UPI003081E1B0
MSSYDPLPEIERLFIKQYEYSKQPDWCLPGASELLSCEHEEFSLLLSLKESLNEVKNRLSDKKLDDWHRHTSFTNKAGRVVPEVRRQANAELCTQAWCKFHEIVCTYPLLPDHALWDSELNTVHLCEAPGAFIASLNHYLKTQNVLCDWSWVANTLNPYHEANDGLMMIVDDRLIANTLPWWYFGPDNTGDIMRRDYLSGLQMFISNMSSVHLVTADGSFDCQGNPGEQEALVYPLHYCEVVTCLETLSPGGSFVLKMFTLFQHSSVNLMYLLNCCFQEVHVIKPGTSKSGNSEVYVVCLHYIGKNSIKDHLTIMTANFGMEIGCKSLFPRRFLPPSFLESHQQCCTFFYEHQTQTILENIELFAHMGAEDKSRLNLLRESAVCYYMDKFQVKYNPRKSWLVKKPLVGCRFNSRWVGTSNRRSDTFNERKQLETLTWEEKVAHGYFNSWINDHVTGNVGRGCLLRRSSCYLKSEGWYLLQGQRLRRIQSSSFCDSELLNAFNETIEGCIEGKKNVSGALFCSSCCLQSAEDVASEFLEMVENGHGILVSGANSVFDVLSRRQLASNFLESFPPNSPISLLHDGDPAYQQHLISLLLCSIQRLQIGDSLLLPVLSAFTRFTAGVVYVLYHCFQTICFSCPVGHLAAGADAVLLCCGYHPLPSSVIQHLQEVKRLVDELLTSSSPNQVLEFIPMEELLNGPFLEFLWDLNSAVIQHSLHLIGLHENQKSLSKTAPITQEAGHT